jgi:hypothetical protein
MALSLSVTSLFGETASPTASPDSTPAHEEGWGSEPLGQPIPQGPVGPALVTRSLPKVFKEQVEDGAPFVGSVADLNSCLIAIGSSSPDNTAYRAGLLLQEYFKLITGVTVPLSNENKVRRVEGPDGSLQFAGPEGGPRSRVFWIGDSQAARDNNVTAGDLGAGGYRITTTPEGLVLIGNDVGDIGSYYAVVSLLERRLGVRWLWPGELGTVLPKPEAFTIPRFSEQDAPALDCRRVRAQFFITGRSDQALGLLEESEEAYKEKYKPTGAWPSLQRLGGNMSILGGHAFGDWYKRFGQQHPDWFALQPDGTRVQMGGRERFCESNQNLAAEVAKDRLQFAAENPGKVIPMAPNDGGSFNFFCMCPECRKLDPSNGPPAELLFAKGPKRTERFYLKYVSLTDRHVTFWNRVAALVLAKKPDAQFTTYAYSAYRDAPLGDALNPAFAVGFVGLTYFNAGERQDDRERWDRWAARASRLYLRPNALLGGRNFPSNYTKELAEDLSHCFQTGMVGVDFDCITHDWATRGLNYYALAKLLWNPGLSAEEIVDDYCRTGFGPAAKSVRAYFDELAECTREAARLNTPEKKVGEAREEEVEAPVMSARERMERSLLAAYSKERIDRMQALLDSAREQAKGDEKVSQRIDFLAVGLEYARLQSASYAAQQQGGDLKSAMQNLLEFLRHTSKTNPLALNTAYLLFEQGARFRILQ